jgi:outer membrane immunogenic protein
MKRLLLASVIAGLSGVSAFAADLPARMYTKAPAYAAVYDWTGFYVGGQIGYAWRDDQNTEFSALSGAPTGFSSKANANGVVGGGHVGYNIQTGPFVFGLEGDFEGAGIDGTGHRRFQDGPELASHFDTKTDWEASFRGRAGYAVNNWLVYGTAGIAWADIKHDYVNGNGSSAGSFNNISTGWTAGAGVEAGFAPNWSTRVEYRYSDFGRLDNVIGGFGPTENHKMTENAVRGGVSYHFPVSALMAKY